MTKHGYLIDLEGHIIDSKGNKVFDKKIVIDGNVPLVFQKIKGPNKEKREQVIIIPRRAKKDDDSLDQQSIRKSINTLSTFSKDDKRNFTADNGPMNRINVIEEEDKDYVEELKSPTRKKFGQLNRLSEDLGGALHQVHTEIRDVGDEINSMISRLED